MLVFSKFHYSSPFYYEQTAKFWSILSALLVWTNLMLCFAKFLEATLFEGSILAWLVGSPILVMIILFDRKLKIDLLLINVNKYETAEDIIN